jgi:hypothetical protein
MQVLKSLKSRGGVARLVPAMALLVLAGCQADPDEKAPQCPVFTTQSDADHVARYDGRSQDLSNLVLNARLLDTPGACKGQLGHKTLTAHVHPVFVLTRGPAAQGREADLQYNVAIRKDGRTLQEKQYTLHVAFPSNVDSVQATGDEIQFSFPTQRGLSGPSYTVFVVLQLSPEELAANQRVLQNK